MTPPRVLIHIGGAKTGSTTIQQLLAVNADVLAAHGVLYPRAGRPRRTLGRGLVAGHHDLPFAVVQGDAGPWTALRREVRDTDAHTVVISTEAFSWFSRAGRVPAVARVFEGHEVGVVLYQRNQLSFAASLYRQGLDAGTEHGSFRSYLERRLDALDYTTRLAGWDDCFGTDALHVHCYEAVREDLVGHFLSHLDGIDQRRLRRPPDLNVTPSDAALHVTRRVNELDLRLRQRIPPVAGVAGFAGKAVRKVIGRDHAPVRWWGLRLARRDGDLTPAVDLEWLRGHPQLAEWNDEFRRRWPRFADPRVFADSAEAPSA